MALRSTWLMIISRQSVDLFDRFEDLSPVNDKINQLTIRPVQAGEYESLGRIAVAVYSALPGFPSPAQQPEYYDMLRNIGGMTEKSHTTVLVATLPDHGVVGGLVYFDDMSAYGSGGTATQQENASGMRLLCVDPQFRGAGAGKALSLECIRLAKDSGNKQLILHTTQAMEVAWQMYLGLGFERSEDLDFMQKDLPVFGFRLRF